MTDVEFPGPFQHHDVVVEGRLVPHLRAEPLDGGRIDLTLDRRLGLVLTVAEAERFVPFLAHAIAVAKGYASHGAGPNPTFPRMTGLILEEGEQKP